MKRISTVLLIMFFVNSFSQDLHKECGFDKIMQKLDDRHPDQKRLREEGEKKVSRRSTGFSK